MHSDDKSVRTPEDFAKCADEMVSMLVGLPEEVRHICMRELKQQNAALHAIVRHRITDIGSVHRTAKKRCVLPQNDASWDKYHVPVDPNHPVYAEKKTAMPEGPPPGGDPMEGATPSGEVGTAHPSREGGNPMEGAAPSSCPSRIITFDTNKVVWSSDVPGVGRYWAMVKGVGIVEEVKITEHRLPDKQTQKHTPGSVDILMNERTDVSEQNHELNTYLQYEFDNFAAFNGDRWALWSPILPPPSPHLDSLANPLAEQRRLVANMVASRKAKSQAPDWERSQDLYQSMASMSLNWKQEQRRLQEEAEAQAKIQSDMAEKLDNVKADDPAPKRTLFERIFTDCPESLKADLRARMPRDGDIGDWGSQIKGFTRDIKKICDSITEIPNYVLLPQKYNGDLNSGCVQGTVLFRDPNAIGELLEFNITGDPVLVMSFVKHLNEVCKAEKLPTQMKDEHLDQIGQHVASGRASNLNQSMGGIISSLQALVDKHTGVETPQKVELKDPTLPVDMIMPQFDINLSITLPTDGEAKPRLFETAPRELLTQEILTDNPCNDIKVFSGSRVKVTGDVTGKPDAVVERKPDILEQFVDMLKEFGEFRKTKQG